MNRKLFSIGLACFIPLLFITHVAQAQDARPMVHLVYFRASDTEPRAGVDAEIEALVKKAQLFFADEMERQGYGRKTFQIETDAHGNTIVHHVVGKSPYTRYLDNFDWEEETAEQIDFPKRRIIVYMIDTHGQEKLPFDAGGQGTGNRFSGRAYIYQWYWQLIAHELGHTFGLRHDFRHGRYIMSYGPGQSQLSACAAEFLDVHRYFNANVNHVNERSEPSTIEMLPPSLVSPPNTIRLRFRITDPDGFHQVQLFIPTSNINRFRRGALTGCKALNGRTSATVEFVTNALTTKTETVYLVVFDVHGQGTVQSFPIDVTDLLPPAEAISIPDINLAAAVQEQIGSITTHTMLNLYVLNASKSRITNLTGLEHAPNLAWLTLDSNNISDVSALSTLKQLEILSLSDNNISDVSALSELTQLIRLQLYGNDISNISVLSGLTNLTYLYLGGNNISDISVLSGLTNLTYLYLEGDNISDISVLSGLTNLTQLYLSSNNISDISMLSGLTNLISLGLGDNNISDISMLPELKNLTWLDLDDNNISDISVLSALTNLTQLELNSNNISDVSPLLALNLIGTMWRSGLRLWNNPLSYVSINTHIPAMLAKGIKIEYNDAAHPALYTVSGNNQEDFVGSVLPAPFVVTAQDASGEPMKNVLITFTVETGSGQLTSSTATTNAQGRAQAHLILGWTPGRNTVRATGKGIESWAVFSAIGIEHGTQIAEDVNRDGVVDVEDLVLVAATIGTTPPDDAIPNTDINGDGIVNAEDLALVMAALATEPTAPTVILTAANLQRWIDEAKQLENKTAIFQRGIAMLEQLLATLLPKKTALLANYPNPSNPETWIPYRLAQSTEVTIHIYAVDGRLVRTLALGEQPAGIYEARHRAAYWDGKNAQGEHIATGIYFYALTAGDFNATRKMLIRK